MGANSILVGTALPGGELVAGMGGYVVVADGACDIVDIVGAAVTRTQFSAPYATPIDVTRWVGRFSYLDTDVTHSGCLGGKARRRVGYDWIARIEVAYDVANPPEIVLNNKASVGMILNLGDPAVYKSEAVVKRYALPSGLLSEVETINDGSATDIVRQTATVKGNSVFFLLPNELDDYNYYIEQLKARGWLE